MLLCYRVLYYYLLEHLEIDIGLGKKQQEF